MKRLLLAAGVALGVLTPPLNPLSCIGTAIAQTREKSREAPDGKETLGIKCRNAVFRKYGQQGISYSARYTGQLVMQGRFVDSAVDRCIAAGGRVD